MPLIPLHDDNPRRSIDAPYVTLALIAANVVIFLYQQSLNPEDVRRAFFGFGVLPVRLFDDAQLSDQIPQVSAVTSLVTSQFLHGGWAHLLFNMLFLWVFGDNIEDSVGHFRFLFFYLVCGAAGGLLHSAVNADSAVPMIGASGAISGVLGAYMVTHPKARILVLAFTFIPIRLPALLVIGTWFAQDLLFAAGGVQNGVAFWAHIGGFVTGAAGIWLVRRPPPSNGPRGPWSVAGGRSRDGRWR